MIRRKRSRNIILLVIAWISSILLTLELAKNKKVLLPETEKLSWDDLKKERLALEEENEENKDYSKEELIEVSENYDSSHVLSCQCTQVHLYRKEFVREEMNKTMKWLNLNTMEHLAKHHPNFPYSIMPLLLEGRCNLIPVPDKMAWSNHYWQEVHVEDTTFFLYSAYIDNRPRMDERPVIRIIAQTLSVTPKAPWCYLWFNASGPPVVSSIRLEYSYWMQRTSTRHNYYYMVCRVPQAEAHRKPLAVSVVEKPCMEAKTLLEVTGALERDITTVYREGKPPPPGSDSTSGFNVAACGTSLFYYHEDFSFRLVEWLEILRAIGFAKVFLHENNVHPNISKVLRYYEEEGLLGVTKHSYAPPIVNEPSILKLWRRTTGSKIAHDLVYFNDCLLRHMHEYRFIAHIDPDEVPMMLQHDSYISWMDDTLKKAAAKAAEKQRPMPCSYTLQWRYHFNDLPPSDANRDLPSYLWNLRHSKVGNKLAGSNIKSLYDMDSVISVVSHYVFRCASGVPKRYGVPRSEAYTGHFHFLCKETCQKPGEVNEVTFLLQYKDQIEKAVTKVLKKLKLI